jgi:hypothetical protein
MDCTAEDGVTVESVPSASDGDGAGATPPEGSDGALGDLGGDAEDGAGSAGTPSANGCAYAGQQESCYGGDVAHAGVGACAYGKRACEQHGEFLAWGECVGWQAPAPERCGDAVDSDCDGDADNGCLACDGVSPVWLDPDKDGSLKLNGTETAALDAGPHTHSRICVDNQAHLNVCESTTVHLTGFGPTVIAGGGVGPAGSFPVTITIIGPLTSHAFILVDTSQAQVELDVDLPLAQVTVLGSGPFDLTFGGKVGSLALGSKSNLLTKAITASGSVQISADGNVFVGGDIVSGGGISVGSPIPVQLTACS